MRYPYRAALAASCLLSLLVAEAKAQTTRPVPAAIPNRLGAADISDAILQGRSQMDANDPRAITTLRDAAQSALSSLTTVSGTNPLNAVPGSLSPDVLTSGTAQRAAEAHLYWGTAADKFAQRDEAIVALARSVRLAQAIGTNTSEVGFLRRDTSNELGRTLREGLPLVAPDDTLDTIATIAHGGLWKPRRVSFNPGELRQELGSGTATPREFLLTSGKVFPPQPGGAATLSPAIPAYYQKVERERLPLSLQMDRVLVGYTRETEGPNRGQWRQTVRVFYASPFLTRGRRDDAPRAEALALQFLRMHSLVRDMLGLSNLYARGDRIGGVTTLWLLEVSALWPADDDDPAVMAQLGPRMPNPNVGPARTPDEPVTTALQRPWSVPIAGNVESSPAEILFWKSSMQRSEAEWLREIAHEYGHVALPPFGGFRPPLEPYGNGMLGETLGLLWAAAIPEQFSLEATPPVQPVNALPAAPGERTATAPRNVSATNIDDALISSFTEHINRQAVPGLKLFKESGPESPVSKRTDRSGVQYLQGLTVYLERVYGPRLLGRVLQPLAARAASIDDPLQRRQLLTTQSLLGTLPTAWKDPWSGQKSLKIWLPGALVTNITAAELVSRGTERLKGGTQTKVWLYVPPGADSLRIDGVGAGNLRSVGLPFTTAGNACRVYFGGKSGWVDFTLNAAADARIDAAQFEKK